MNGEGKEQIETPDVATAEGSEKKNIIEKSREVVDKNVLSPKQVDQAAHVVRAEEIISDVIERKPLDAISAAKRSAKIKKATDFALKIGRK